MGVNCNQESRDRGKNRIIRTSEIDTNSNNNNETDVSIENLKNEIRNLEKNQENLIKKINEKFNIINNGNSINKLNYKKITFKFQDDNEPSIVVDIYKNIKMNQIYQEIKSKKPNLPQKNDLTFFYGTLDITSLFICNLSISKFNINLNTPITIIYNNVKMPEGWNIN